MTIEALKLDLTRKIMDSNNLQLINHIKAIFDTEQDNWFDELPNEIQNSVNIGLKQSENNEGISHKEAMIAIEEWLKK
ncbi:MAG: hypothetical protein JHD28_10300 [Bacteroidia bacterium]|nr:hypothetical protein [Bacteroidia bacterium]